MRKAPSLKETLAANKGSGPKGYVLMSLVRPAGPYLAWLALQCGVRPRTVTYASLILASLIPALTAFGGARARALAPLLIVFWQILDVTDGSMARAIHAKDNFGGFVDYAAGIALIGAMPLALGIAVARAPDRSLEAVAGALLTNTSMSQAAMVAIGGGITGLSLYLRVLNVVLQLRFGSAPGGGGDAWQNRRMRQVPRLIVRNIESVGGLQALAWILAAYFRFVEAVLAFYFVFYLGIAAAFSVSVYRSYSPLRAYR